MSWEAQREWTRQADAVQQQEWQAQRDVEEANRHAEHARQKAKQDHAAMRSVQDEMESEIEQLKETAVNNHALYEKERQKVAKLKAAVDVLRSFVADVGAMHKEGDTFGEFGTCEEEEPTLAGYVLAEPETHSGQCRGGFEGGWR